MTTTCGSRFFTNRAVLKHGKTGRCSWKEGDEKVAARDPARGEADTEPRKLLIPCRVINDRFYTNGDSRVAAVRYSPFVFGSHPESSRGTFNHGRKVPSREVTQNDATARFRRRVINQATLVVMDTKKE